MTAAARREARKIRQQQRPLAAGLLFVVLPCILFGLANFYGGAAAQEENAARALLSGCDPVVHNGSHAVFPAELFTDEQKDKGAIVLYLIGAIYCFIGLYLVCDNYFEPSLVAISAALELTEDVAGATFMASGSSAPELFTSFMGVFVAKSDVGVGTIVGSAVFNMLVIVGLCGIYVAHANRGKDPSEKLINIQCNWYVVLRDVVFYCISIVLLVFFILDQVVNMAESVILFAFYILYVLWMKYNSQADVYMQEWLQTYLNAQKSPTHPKAPSKWQLSVRVATDGNVFNGFMYFVIIANTIVVILEYTSSNAVGTDMLDILNWTFIAIYFMEMFLKMYGYQFVGYFLDSWNLLDFILVGLIILELSLAGTGGISSASRSLRLFRVMRGLRTLRVFRLGKIFGDCCGDDQEISEKKKAEMELAETKKHEAEEATATEAKQTGTDDVKISMSNEEATSQLFGDAETLTALQAKESASSVEGKHDATDDKDGDDDDDSDDEDDYEQPDSPFDFPSDEDLGSKVFWIIAWPVAALFYYTIPHTKDPAGDEGKYNYIGAFTMSIVWISAYCYLMVWMATVIGKTFGIPDPVMGLTFLAAGTSLPDALASLGVALKGKADQAVANANGSNVFDICIGLALPWMIAVGIRQENVTIMSDALMLTVFVLFLCVALFVLAMKAENWRISARFGWFLMFIYCIFVAESLLLEYGVICL